VSRTGHYLAELHVRRDAGADLGAVVARAGAAAAHLTCEGVPVRCVSSIYVRGDETLLLLFEGPSAAAVGDAVVRAGLRWERVLDVDPNP
jgi:hypothetical protein